MALRSFFHTLVLVKPGFFGLASAIHASDVTWNVATGSWDDPANWLGGVPTSGDNAVFFGGTATLAAGVSGSYASLALSSVASGTSTVKA